MDVNNNDDDKKINEIEPVVAVQDVEIIDSATPLFLGGGRTISAVYGGIGNKTVVGFNIEVKTPGGRVLKSYPVSLEDGRNLIHTAVTQMASSSTTSQLLADEVAQSILPVQVAIQYVNELRKLGTPEDQLPKTVDEVYVKIDKELKAYLKLGEQQIALRTQQVQDSMLSLSLQVYNGNRTTYDGLPKAMKEKVDFIQHLIMVMAVENSGFSPKTVEVNRQLVAMKFTSSEEFMSRVDRITQSSPKAAQAFADAIAGFVGGILGGTVGAIKSSFNRNKENNEE